MSQADTEEECSFLKIENVISLAPKSDNTGNENSIVSGEYVSQYFLIFEILSKIFNLLNHFHYIFILLLHYSHR